ncbi:MAG TPA: glycosyltransferase family 4 protein [Thermoguttaceae bacterium]
MIVVVSTEGHFSRTPDGCIRSQMAQSYLFWKRYLEVFDGVRIVARLSNVPSPPLNSLPVDGPGVAIAAVPDYLGPWQYLRNIIGIRRAVQGGIGPDDAIIMRVPSVLSNSIFSVVKASERPYAVEVLGDPWDVFAPGVVSHPLRPFIRRYSTSQLKIICANACAAAYVTDFTLQRRYPISRGKYKTSYSSIILPENAMKSMSAGVSNVELHGEYAFSFPRLHESPDNAFRLVMVGSLAQLYKGADVAIKALHLCVRAGWNILLTIIGDGKYRPSLERLTARLGLTERVIFRGQLPQGNAVFDELNRNDLFIMPSRTEGLPRAMIEAMSQGLPCIGSCVGGIPELLPPEDMFPPNDAQALAAKICDIIAYPDRVRHMSARNLERAKDFREEILHNRRMEFYRFIREHTAEWLERKRAA